MGQEVFETVEPDDQFYCRLLTDSRHPGNIVAGVPGQGPHLHQLLRGEAVLFADDPGVEAHPLHGVPHRHPLLHQGQQVLITGDDLHLKTLGPGPVHQGADEVVGFETLQLQEPAAASPR